MDNYAWQKNRAVVDRMYYTERVFTTTTLFASMYTATSMLYMKLGYQSNIMRARIPPVWMYWAATNAVVAFIMLKPLRSEEIAAQWHKRQSMGKYLYSTFHLDGPLKEEDQ
mmetsp:Transcript_38413/g.27832  ORF Transcript_38413/g.27832 Transcript_38413/m.27832 type:complete len:111 (+) Transcript_38413:41-373(+)|eukprot:CAMPEP_0116876086 /NCGR_PEP_ID=MMETSP0463-20121206/8123_1 /TAXON_ID=181622 /ORGANISM="Strombidinopsis sp, Strain SopsisLIS2011" /LENGTH=110 /DNA_ID=CAMNT_0004522529 /DNA_START=26 /DNA_END=358 /DNA_ORIENTATION=+